MTDVLVDLSRFGGSALTAFWIPIGVWTLLALATESVLRARDAGYTMGLAARSALLVALPGLPLLTPALAPFVPSLLPAAQGVPFIGPLPDLPSAGVTAAPVWGAANVALGLAALACFIAGLVAIARLGLSVLRTRSVLLLERAPAPIQAEGEQIAREFDLRAPDIRMAEPTTVPFTLGWLRPVVVLPAGLSGTERTLSLTHEIAHIRRSDSALHLLERVIGCAFIWHPLVHVVSRGLELDRERTIDASVMGRHPDLSGTYARLLYSFADRHAPPLALGAAVRPSQLHSRLDAMNNPTPSRPRLARALGFVLLLSPVLALAAFVPDAAPRASAWAASTFTIEGRIVDAVTGNGIAGASVVAVTSESGAASGPDGAFLLRAPDGTTAIRVSATGYGPRYVRVMGTTTGLTVELTPSDIPPSSISQSASEAPVPDVFAVAERMPEMIGGMAGFAQRLTYPSAAMSAGTEGTVFLSLVVDESGAPTRIEVLRSPDASLSEAAVQAMQATRFEPGLQRGEPVKVQLRLPVRFELAD